MATEYHARVQAEIETLLGLPAAERAERLNRLREVEPELAAEAAALLPHAEQLAHFEPARPGGSLWKLPGTTTFEGLRDEARADALDAVPEPPFCLGQYRVERILGRGGMGVVYRAMHATLRRPVAIKLLRRRLQSREDRQRFALEVEILRRLQHPGVARLIYADTLETAYNAHPYFVMEYIEGESLLTWANSHGLDTRQRLLLLLEICAAVEYAHQRGIVHRDLKPDNILVDKDGRARVLDFGVARVLSYQPGLMRGEEGRFIGTPRYASPEQLAGRNEQLAPRSDVYSLGLIAHELLGGDLPPRTGSRTRATLAGVRLEPDTSRISDVDREFAYYCRVIVQNALLPEEQRYRSAGELGADLEQLLRTYPPAASRWERLKRLARRFLGGQPEWTPSAAARPLSAVLRTRISMALESGLVRDSKDDRREEGR